MTYKGGTPTAQSCIEQLKDLEALVDIYSKEWLAANPEALKSIAASGELDAQIEAASIKLRDGFTK
jgi:hypothetical protein